MMITPRQNCLCEEVATQKAARRLGIPQRALLAAQSNATKQKKLAPAALRGGDQVRSTTSQPITSRSRRLAYEPGNTNLGRPPPMLPTSTATGR